MGAVPACQSVHFKWVTARVVAYWPTVRTHSHLSTIQTPIQTPTQIHPPAHPSTPVKDVCQGQEGEVDIVVVYGHLVESQELPHGLTAAGNTAVGVDHSLGVTCGTHDTHPFHRCATGHVQGDFWLSEGLYQLSSSSMSTQLLALNSSRQNPLDITTLCCTQQLGMSWRCLATTTMRSR